MRHWNLPLATYQLSKASHFNYVRLFSISKITHILLIIFLKIQ